MCQAMYTHMCVLCLDYQKTAAMEKLFYFFLQTYSILPKWLKDAEDQSKKLLEPGVKNISEDTKDASSVAVDSDDQDDEQYEEEVSYVCSYH